VSQGQTRVEVPCRKDRYESGSRVAKAVRGWGPVSQRQTIVGVLCHKDRQGSCVAKADRGRSHVSQRHVEVEVMCRKGRQESRSCVAETDRGRGHVSQRQRLSQMQVGINERCACRCASDPASTGPHKGG